jgi:3-oxoacyl-[acyl-carrier-protein] synthase-3
MRLEDVYIAGTGSWLPPRVSVEDVVAFGLCDQPLVRMNDMAAVTVATDKDSPPEMAAAAARTALERAGCGPDDIELILHANVCFQGHELWAPASYVQRAAVGNRCPAMEVKQASNGGMAALYMAAAYLTGGPGRSAALVTAADTFPLPAVDRWRSDPGTVYADGGAALVLSRRGGFARLHSVVLVSDPDLEGMHRAGDAFGTAPMTLRRPVNLEAHKNGFLAQTGIEATLTRLVAGQQEALETALDEAGTRLDDINRFVLPHFGRRRLDTTYLRQLDINLEQTTWSFSREVGHLGAADQLASLNHLVESDSLRPGDRCLLMGVGSGFSWSAAVMEIVEAPQWDS